MPAPHTIPRYCPERSLPETIYVPGLTERHADPVEGQDTTGWTRFAVDLFNHGHYWLAHEVWEQEWVQAGRRGVRGDRLKGLIKLAAAGVKKQQKVEPAMRHHARRAVELLQKAMLGNVADSSDRDVFDRAVRDEALRIANAVAEGRETSWAIVVAP